MTGHVTVSDLQQHL